MSDRRRVLLCSFEVYPSPSGGARRLSAYLPALNRRFDVVALTLKLPELSHVERVGEARLLRVPVSADLVTRVQTFERAVRRQLQSESYALVHFMGPFGGYPICEEREQHGYKLIYEATRFPSQELAFHNPELENDRRLISRFRRQELFCLMNADRVLTGSGVTQTFVRSLGVAKDSVRVLRSPVDLGALSAERVGAPDGTPLRLLYLGNQAPYQGLPTLLRGMAKAVGRADVTLRIAGPRHPDWQPQLQDLADELKIADRVEFLPPVAAAELPKLLANADVGVAPLEATERNHEQGGPLAKVSDYLGAGRPVLASDLPLTRELLPGDGAVFFPPGDSDILADRIVSLANDVGWRLALGAEARAFAEEKLDAAMLQAQLLALYEELLGEADAPAEADEKPRPLGPQDETRAFAPPRSEPEVSTPSVRPPRSSPAVPARSEAPSFPRTPERRSTPVPARPPERPSTPFPARPAARTTTPPSAPAPERTKTPGLTRSTMPPPDVTSERTKTPSLTRSTTPPPDATSERTKTPSLTRSTTPPPDAISARSETPSLPRSTTPPPPAAPERTTTPALTRSPMPSAMPLSERTHTPESARPAVRTSTPRPSDPSARPEPRRTPPTGAFSADQQRLPSPLEALARAGGLEAEADTSPGGTPLPPELPSSPPPLRIRPPEASVPPSLPEAVVRTNAPDAGLEPEVLARIDALDEEPEEISSDEILEADALADAGVAEVAEAPEAAGTAVAEVAEVPEVPVTAVAEAADVADFVESADVAEPVEAEPVELVDMAAVVEVDPVDETSDPAHGADASLSVAVPESAEASGSTPAGSAPAAASATVPEAVEEVEEVDAVEAVEDASEIEEILDADAEVEIPPTIPGQRVDPWRAQILFGYCPPESAHFTRPTPPTNFPGRDDPAANRTTSSTGLPAHSLSNGGNRGVG